MAVSSSRPGPARPENSPSDQQRRAVIGIHTNIKEGSLLDNPAVGHAWISVHKEGQDMATFGAWPQKHPVVTDFGQERGWNGSGTHLRQDIELAGGPAAASRYYTLTPQQVEKLDAALDRPCQWSPQENCAFWAARTVEEVTGEKVASRDPRVAYLTYTPSSLGNTLDRLERETPTSAAIPLTAQERSPPADHLERSNRLAKWQSHPAESSSAAPPVREVQVPEQEQGHERER